MKIAHLYSTAFVAAAVSLTCPITICGEEATNTIKFSDPSKPGTVKINLGRGELRVQGTDTTEVGVKSDAKAVTSKPRKDGMRVISAASSFSLGEKDNVVTLDAASHDWGRGGGDFKLTVPRTTTVIVQNAWGGSVSCAGISGDIEVSSMQGEIRLDDIAGGVVASTMNGEIRAGIRELRDGKPLSFTSMNGEVVLTLPETAKANVRLRTQNGSVLTNFDETALVTKTEAMVPTSRGKVATVYKTDRVLTVEIQNAIREAVQLGVTGAKEALEAVKEGIEAAKIEMDEARRQVDSAKRDIDRARRDSERERRTASRSGNQNEDLAPPAAPAAKPSPAAMPAPVVAIAGKIPIPTITGGKLVTGTLNGGGPEISVATMNGDVTLKKLVQK